MMVAETMLSSVLLTDAKSRLSAAGLGQDYLGRQADNDVYPTSPMETSGAVSNADIFNQRKQREFIPDNKKDDSYWDRRRRNNEAAKRSREKRRFNDMVLETRVVELTRENCLLRAQLAAIRDKFGIVGENLIDQEQALAQLPAIDQILSVNKRHRSQLLQLAATSGPAPPAAYRPATPPSAPASIAALQTSPFVFRQQSLRELPAERIPEHPASAFTAAINLSRSASTVDYPVSPSGGAGGDTYCLPLKLRHKPHLGEREAVASLLALNQMKVEVPELKVEPQEVPASPPSPCDEPDSGLSDRSASSDYTEERSSKRRCSEARDPLLLPPPPPPPASGLAAEGSTNSGQIRSELQRLAIEVATLKSRLSQRADGGRQPADA